jgi:hypothetical protein
MTVADGASWHLYRVFGLLVRSSFALPELDVVQAPGAEDPDVAIEAGPVGDTLPGGVRLLDWMIVDRQTSLFVFPGLGRMSASGGTRIVIDLEPGAPESHMRTYLFGSGFGALLHQRKLMPLHVSAVRTPTGVWAFTGDPGTGKSTLAGLLHRRRGWPLLCDDMAVIHPDDPEPLLHAGVNRLKLWKDAVAAVGTAGASLTRDIARQDKFHLHDPAMFDHAPAPLRGLVMLDRGETVALTPICGAQRLMLLLRAVYRPFLTPVHNDVDPLARHAARIANGIEGYSLTRPWDPEALAATAEAIADAIEARPEAQARSHARG